MIPGLTYIPNFISPEEHDSLVEIINSQPWSYALKRRTQHYGYKYDYTKKKIDSSSYLGPLPKWSDEYVNKIKPWFNTIINSYYPGIDQIIVNEYLPGQGISKHIDCTTCFTNTIISLSLLTPCVMVFENTKENARKETILDPASLLVFQGDARYNWLHSIPVITEKRISLTFRRTLI